MSTVFLQKTKRIFLRFLFYELNRISFWVRSIPYIKPKKMYYD